MSGGNGGGGLPFTCCQVQYPSSFMKDNDFGLPLSTVHRQIIRDSIRKTYSMLLPLLYRPFGFREKWNYEKTSLPVRASLFSHVQCGNLNELHSNSI